MAIKAGTWVVVATSSRPWLVVCGRLKSKDENQVCLTEARCAVFWPTEVRSIFGLASRGPSTGACISPPCKSIVLSHVELVLEATDEAVKAWQKEPWS